MEFWLLIGGGIILFYVLKSMVEPSKEKEQQTSTRVPQTGIRITMETATRGSVDSDDYDDYDQDGDLTTFRISYGYEEEKSKNKMPGRWVKPGETLKVNGQETSKGYFYYGGQLKSLDGYGTDASLVDDSLKIEKQQYSYEDESLGYWPKFISLSPKGRGAYLNWLLGDRSDSEIPLGYVFIYFYGLERRVTVDFIEKVVDDLEFIALFEEVVRLKGIYDNSRSFSRYSTRLLEIMCLLRPSVVSLPEFEKEPGKDSLLFKHQLATTVNDGKPVTAEMALAWIRFYPDYSLKKPARRCSKEFSLLFMHLYTGKYGDGIIVKPNKTRLKNDYSPASSSLRGLSLPQEDLPDPSNLKGPLNKLITIADECTAELDGYSRYLGKPDTSPTDIEAVLLLPDSLSDLGETLGLEEFKKWADDAVLTNNGLVDLDEFWGYTKSPLPAKIYKKEAELIQNLAQKAGYGIAPDTRYHHAKSNAGGKLVLFPEGHGKYFKPSKAFSEMGMALRLGAMVAAIDSHVDQAELNLLTQLIDHDTNLSPIEKRSLRAYLVWRLNTPSTVLGLKARIGTLGKPEKAAVSRILISIAMADGRIDPEEIKQLEKLYTSLGLDKALVTGDIHGMSSSKAGLAEANPQRENKAAGSGSFQLNESILAIHESETKDIQSMLGAIFVEDEPESDSDETDAETIHVNEESGIDKQHYALFEKLIGKDKWPREEVEGLCRELGLMLDGALETINEWSFEKVDAAVLEEEGDTIYVDQELVEEIEG
jgi:tellurite resistance protein